jgi:hypothetical protein
MGTAHHSLMFLILCCVWAVPILQNFVCFALSLVAELIAALFKESKPGRTSSTISLTALLIQGKRI